MDIIRRNAFTLIELLAVILILGIIALIAIPTVNKVLKESKIGAFNTTAVTLGNKAEEACQLENLKGEETTSLYTIVEGELDKPLEIKGDLPREGYILVNDKCEVAYSFYDENNVVSKSFLETKAVVNNKDTAPAYGLKWQSNTVEGDDYLTDTYTRTLDASDINDASVKPQIGTTPVINAFDELDIYKDIVPYTDSFGNEFMLIPKFYISKTKEVTDTEVIWNYAVSKHKLDDSYYLPSNFVDEGEDNNKHIELPYVLVGKYEAGSNGASGNEEMLVSNKNVLPKTALTINEVRSLTAKYNDINEIKGYQQYDIHIHDLLTILFVIEFKTMNSQQIMTGYIDNAAASITGKSDFVTSSSGTLDNDGHNSFHYRGIENLWGNITIFVEGVNINQKEDLSNDIYVGLNSRHYSSDEVTEFYTKISGYNKSNENGLIVDVGMDPEFPFVNLATKVNADKGNGSGDYYYQNTAVGYWNVRNGGIWNDSLNAGIHYNTLGWISAYKSYYSGSRLVVTPLRN